MTEPKCQHDHLEFRDQGTRIVCTNPTCGITWCRETSHGSMMPFMGTVPWDEMVTNCEKRSNPFVTQTYPLRLWETSGKVTRK